MAMPAPRTRALARLGGYLDFNDAMDVPPGAPSESEGIRSAQMTPPPAEQQEMQTSEPPNELEALKEQQRRSVFAADIGRSGAMIAEAISGAKAPMALYDRLETRAGEPLQEYMERLKLNARTAKSAPKPGKPQKSTDPNSPESKRAQLLVKATLSDKFTDEEIAQLTEADADNALKYGSLSGQREVSREGLVDANTRAKEQRDLTREQGSLNRGIDWAKIHQAADQFGASQDLRERLAMLELAEKQAGRAQQAQEKVDEQSKDLGKEWVSQGFADFYEQHKLASQILDKYKSLPGVGAVQGRIWDRLTSDDGKQLRYAANQMMLAYQKSITGTGASDKERETITRATGLMDTNDDASIRLGMKIVKDIMDAKANALRAGYKPEAVTTVESRRSGQRAPVRAPATSVLPTDASGTPTLDAPQAIPDAPKLAPGQKLVDVLEEGKPVRATIGGQQRVVVKRGGKLKIVEGQ